MRWPGVEPGSTAWKAAMLTAIPPTLDNSQDLFVSIKDNFDMMFSFF